MMSIIDMQERLAAQDLIDALGLEEHQEGGYFRQTYKADHLRKVTTESGDRTLMTSIYYLLTQSSPLGRFHLNKSDIVHYFHYGDPIRYHMIYPDGQYKAVTLGQNLKQGQQLQYTVPGGVWKASKLNIEDPYGFGLIGEAVAPGFEYPDLVIAKEGELISAFPQHKDLIKGLIPT
jgi:predicted cupin superfamily sugar epimerase